MKQDSSTTPINLQETAAMIDRLERDLARLDQGQVDVAELKEDLQRLRSLLSAHATTRTELHTGLAGLRERLHDVSDELFDDAMKAGDYMTRIGRLLGM